MVKTGSAHVASMSRGDAGTSGDIEENRASVLQHVATATSPSGLAILLLMH